MRQAERHLTDSKRSPHARPSCVADAVKVRRRDLGLGHGLAAEPDNVAAVVLSGLLGEEPDAGRRVVRRAAAGWGRDRGGRERRGGEGGVVPCPRGSDVGVSDVGEDRAVLTHDSYTQLVGAALDPE